MTKEEVASIVKYCNDNSVSYKTKLSELGVPEWKFFEGKRRYAKVQIRYKYRQISFEMHRNLTVKH